MTPKHSTGAIDLDRVFCFHCAYWVQNQSSDLRGECRRNPPVALTEETKIDGERRVYASERWPLTDEIDSCGEYVDAGRPRTRKLVKEV